MELKTRRRFIASACLLLAFALRAERACATIHHGRVDDLDRAVGTLQAHPPDVRAENRNRGARRGARHGSGARPRAPRRCGRGVRAREVRRGAVPPRGPRRAALSRHVQRLRHRSGRKRTRPESPAAPTRSTRCARSRMRGAPFVSRGDRSGTHIAEVNLWTMAGIDIDRRRKARGIARPGKAWARRSTPPRR